MRSKVEPLVLKSPPTIPPRPLSSFVRMPFDRPEHAIGYGQNDVDFNKDEACGWTATMPKPANPSTLPGVVVQYHLHRHGQDATILAGSSVLSWESVCPPFESCPNKNLFQQFFGIEFHHDDHTYIRAISTYEFSHCFGLVDNIQYRLSHDNYKFGLDASMPGRTSSWIFDQVHSHLKQQDLFTQSVCCPRGHNSDSHQWRHLHPPSFKGAVGPGIYHRH